MWPSSVPGRLGSTDHDHEVRVNPGFRAVDNPRACGRRDGGRARVRDARPVRAPPPTTVHRCGVFTLVEAAAAGWTHDALRHAVATGRLERVRTGCYAPPPSDDLSRFAAADLQLARQSIAASLTIRHASVSHLGAAHVLGVPIWAPEPRACVTTSGPVTRVSGVHVHRSAVHPRHTGVVGGVAITTAERTIADVAREFGVEAGLVVADAAVRRGLASREVLADVIATLGRRSDVTAAFVVAAMLDPAVESPLESRSRWHLACHDVFPPRPQMDILTREGVFVGRTDFYWPEGVVGEVDGSAKYASDADGANEVLGAEKWRQQALEDLGLEVVRWGARHLRDFRPTVARLRRAFARAQSKQGERLWIAVPSATSWS